MDLDFTREERTYPLIPEDTYQAVLCEVKDLGLQQGKFDDQPVPKVELYFQTEPIPVTEDGEEKTKRFILKTFPLKKSKDDRSGYYKAFQALMGGKIDPTIKKSEDLIGRNVQLEIIHGMKDGEPKFNNIKSITKVKSSLLYDLKVEDYKSKGDETDFNYGDNADEV